MSTKKTKKSIARQNSRLRDTPIAIIGISALFPQSKNVRAYWDNIINEVDCITDVPPSRWKLEDYYDPDPKTEDKTFCKRGGFVPDIEFDPMEFGLPPNMLELTDVHQLMSLVLAKEVLKDGGYENPPDEIRENIAVIMGVGGGQKLMIPLISRLQYPIWERVLRKSGVSEQDTAVIVEKIKKAYVGWEESSFPGALGNIIAGRIANRLDLGGTNCVVDAACASSLSGIRLAVSELLEYRAEMVISGGVDVDTSPYMYLCFSKTPAFSQDDIMKPFDNSSNGMLMGEGIGMVLLKRLEDAERDNNRIYAIIRGIGSSSDGRYKSIYAPRVKGQILALERAYKDADISPACVDMIEAHGTGTNAGDLAEIKALKEFYATKDTQKQHIALGSVKSQLGHLKNAAGSASIIKTTMALYHKMLPATINIKEPHKDFDLENSPFYFNTSGRPWIRTEKESPRRAGLSAFGFGGTNFHFILEEYKRKPSGRYRLNSVAQPIILSASTPQDLLEYCRRVVTDLREDENGVRYRQLTDQGKSEKIPLENARVGFVSESVEEAISHLETTIKNLEEKRGEEFWSLPKGIHYREKGVNPAGKVVALFAGQGSPYLNMGKELVVNFPPLMSDQVYMDELFIKDNLPPLSQVVYPIPVFDKAEKKRQATRLQLTENAQPAIGVFSAGQFQILKDAGFKPDFTAGHSFGELTALWAAGVFKDKDFFKLAKARGKAMAAPNDPDFDAGSMLAVMGELGNLKADIKGFPEVTMANLNSKSQIVLAGPTDEVKKAQAHLKKKKYRTVLLGVSAAFHTKLVGHAQKPFAEEIDSVKFKKPKCAVYSNASGKPHSTDPKEIQKALKEHILNSVRFREEIETIYSDGGFFFVEFGPQSILSKLVENILEGKPYVSVALNASAKANSDRQFREGVVKLKVAGVRLKEIDPFESLPEISDKKKKPLTLTISGSNYVSEKTRKAFEESLNDGFKIQNSAPVVRQPVDAPAKKQDMSRSSQPQDKAVATRRPSVNLNAAMESIERGLANFYHHQNETLSIHQQFLNNQSEYSRGFFQIMDQQSRSGSVSLPPEVSRNIAQFHEHQSETLRVHDQYLRHQTEYAKHTFELIRHQQALLNSGQAPRFDSAPNAAEPVAIPAQAPPAMSSPRPVPSPVQPPPAPTPIPQPEVTLPVPPPVSNVQLSPVSMSRPDTVEVKEAGVDINALSNTLLEVVGEKTGYQADMLELSMDMEADLGIDSIKRVEILNGIQEKMPELPAVNPEELAELRTLEQIVNHMSAQVSPATRTTDKRLTVKQPASIDTASFTTLLLDIVSEKTGYQSDMLELSMDMEADLGIDSIKRVEILNGIQEKMPELPAVNPEELAELRTLAQIVDHMLSQAAPVAECGAGTASPQATPPSAGHDVGTAVLPPATSSTINTNDFTTLLLSVVSEKTGYQSDMLELSMDMEADLGIDSIKRVEILNGIQEKMPELPAVNPEELAELRTLEQIVTHMLSQANTSSGSQSVADSAADTSPVQGGAIDMTMLTRVLLEVVSEKTGYQSDMLELSMDMEADLGIDSIKRVEILNGMQEKMAALPEVNPEELAELRTLEQIVARMGQATTEKKTPLN